MSGQGPDPTTFQRFQPGAQQRRRLHDLRKHTPRRADEGFGSEICRPLPYLVGREGIERRAQPRRGVTEAFGKDGVGFGMGNVQAGFSGEQELARDRWHAVVDGDRVAALRQPLRRHQPAWPAAHNGDVLLSHALARSQIPCRRTLGPAARGAQPRATSAQRRLELLSFRSSQRL
ncbi:hypothetical protein D9M70_555450 [compost metagenome]